jgi:glycerophosphoryl diester phosphodiesterase
MPASPTTSPFVAPDHPYFRGATPRVFAHRGLALGVPENTLGAFHRAVDAGATYLELDVHGSSDGVAVVSHDRDLARVAGRPARVSELTSAALRVVDLGHGEGFVTLDEVFAAFPSARFNIDIKSSDAVVPTAAAILRAGAQGRVLVASFSEARRAAVVRRVPGVATSASSSRVALAVLGAKLGLQSVVRAALGTVHAVQIPVRARGVTIATRRVIAGFHRAGVEVHIWTINDRATMERLLDLGIDGLVTDRADVAVRLVDERAFPRSPK